VRDFQAFREKVDAHVSTDDPKHEKLMAWAHGARIGKNGLNEHGIFTEGEEIRIGKNYTAYVEINFIQAPGGHWLYGLSYYVGNGGGGYMPGVYNRIGYESREAVIEAAISDMLSKLQDKLKSTDNPTVKAAKALKDEIDAFQLSRAQPSLF